MIHSEPTARQAQLLDLALELIQEHGLAGLTVRRLAERAGFSEAALYRHYTSKQALLQAVAKRIASSILVPVERIAAKNELSPRERLELILTHQTRTILAVRGLPILLLAEGSTSGDEELLSTLGQAIDRFVAILGDLVRETRGRRESDELPTAAEIAHLLFGLGTATAIRHRLHADEELEKAAVTRLPAYLVDRLVGPAPREREE